MAVRKNAAVKFLCFSYIKGVTLNSHKVPPARPIQQDKFEDKFPGKPLAENSRPFNFHYKILFSGRKIVRRFRREFINFSGVIKNLMYSDSMADCRMNIFPLRFLFFKTNFMSITWVKYI